MCAGILCLLPLQEMGFIDKMHYILKGMCFYANGLRFFDGFEGIFQQTHLVKP
jgi:hypothetical protein